MGLLRVVLKVLLKEERVGVQILAYEEIQIRKGTSATTLRLEAVLRLSDARRLLGFTKKKSDIRVLKGCRAQATRLRAEGPLHASASFSRLFAKSPISGSSFSEAAAAPWPEPTPNRGLNKWAKIWGGL